jgi:hypothetical protein
MPSVNFIEIESDPILDADPPAQGVKIARRMTGTMVEAAGYGD